MRYLLGGDSAGRVAVEIELPGAGPPGGQVTTIDGVLEKAGKTAVIPPKANRKKLRAYNKELYKARHLIENFFA